MLFKRGDDEVDGIRERLEQHRLGQLQARHMPGIYSLLSLLKQNPALIKVNSPRLVGGHPLQQMMLEITELGQQQDVKQFEQKCEKFLYRSRVKLEMTSTNRADSDDAQQTFSMVSCG